MEDSGDTFDEEVPVDTQPGWGIELFREHVPLRRVRASRAGIAIDGMPSIAHDQIVSAFLSTRIGHHVIVAYGRTRLAIHTRTRDEAERLLSALACTATEKNAAFRLLPPSHFIANVQLAFVLAFLFSFLFVRHVPHALGYFAVAALVALPLLTVAIFGRRLIVGRDGVSISDFWSKRFVSYADIISVNRYSDRAKRPSRRGRRQHVYSGVALHLRSGEDLQLPITRSPQPSDELFGASERIEEALKAWRGSAQVDDAVIDRAGRDTREWISSLRQLGKSDATTYRVAAVDREALFAIVEDPANQAVSRVAAAVAISGRLDDESRARLLKSAETVADPKLRVAIAHVIEENAEADLEKILDDLDPIEAKRS